MKYEKSPAKKYLIEKFFKFNNNPSKFLFIRLGNIAFFFLKYMLIFLLMLFLSIFLFFLIKFLYFSFFLESHYIYLFDSAAEKSSEESSLKEESLEDFGLEEEAPPQLFNSAGLPVNSPADQKYDNIYIKFLKEYLYFNDDLIYETLFCERPEHAASRREKTRLAEIASGDAWRYKFFYGLLIGIVLLTVCYHISTLFHNK